MTIGPGRDGLRRLGEPEDAVEALLNARLFNPNRDIVLLSARSDASMQVEDVTRFLRAFPYRNYVFILHRAPYGRKQLEQWGGDERAIYCTTITPKPPSSGPESWTPVKPEAQLRSIRFLLENGVPHKRISLMTGPFNANNVDAGVELIRYLAQELGFTSLTYRGCSVGEFGVQADTNRLRREGFLDGAQDETAAPEGHTYYQMKNWLAPEVEDKLLEAGERNGVRMYHLTGVLYQREYGVPVAYNRNNRWRRELGQWKQVEVGELDTYLRRLGYHPLGITQTEEGYLVELDETEVATEDVAMTVGAKFETSVIFNRHRIAPTVEDLRFYAENRLFPLPNGWRNVL